MVCSYARRTLYPIHYSVGLKLLQMNHQMPRESTNLLKDMPRCYIYLKANQRFCAYKRFPLDTPILRGGGKTYKFFNKAALFYSFEDAKNWLESLPEKMDRPIRDAPAEY